MTDSRKHRILLVNFDTKEAERIRRAGYNVELGYIGKQDYDDAGQIRVPCSLPHPPYESDVYVYNSRPGKKLAQALTSAQDLLTDKGAIEALSKLDVPPYVRIVFTGECEGPTGLLVGVPFLKIEAAHTGVSRVIPAREDVFSIGELDQLIKGYESSVERPVAQFIRLSVPHDRLYPFHHIRLFVSRNYDVIAAYGTTYGRKLPYYIILPQFRDNTRVLLDLLDTLARIDAELFPDLKIHEWIDSEEFVLREEKEIDAAIRVKIEAVKGYIDEKQREKGEIKRKFGFITQVLIATEEAEKKEERLSSYAKRVLEFIGFEVQDMDNTIRSAIKKEDFWVMDKSDGFVAITEVSATQHKNPKTKEYSDLLGRMTTVLQRQEYVPKARAITGLLILNYDVKTHPAKRPLLYSKGDEEFVKAAKQYQIGLLSTVELYKIAIAVKDGPMMRAEAMKLIKQFGRIEFPSPGGQKV